MTGLVPHRIDKKKRETGAVLCQAQLGLHVDLTFVTASPSMATRILDIVILTNHLMRPNPPLKQKQHKHPQTMLLNQDFCVLI